MLHSPTISAGAGFKLVEPMGKWHFSIKIGQQNQQFNVNVESSALNDLANDLVSNLGVR
jgi:hypothetical protein